jgi:GNAT superfamily N-acetyltransferase
LGSIIEVFSDTARAWRGTSVPGTGAVRVRMARLEDFAALRALRREAHAVPWSLKQLESRRHAFPEGQLVAECGGEVVAAASALIVRWDEHELDHTWRSVTGDGFFTTHDPAGRTLYCAELVADLQRHGAGVGRVLFQAERRLCRKLNLRRMIHAARLPGYRAVKDEMTPELYAQRVIWGDLVDPSLSFFLAQGLQYCGIIRNYLPEDAESCGNSALAVWLNPFHSPSEPPANVEKERRRCA